MTFFSKPTSSPLKHKIIFIIGGPGSGKGTQCDQISHEFDFEHLSTGNILRNIISKRVLPGWEDLKEKIEKGALISSSELIKYIKEELKDKNKTILLDGFPRNEENIQVWNNEMKDSCGVIAVVYFECSKNEMRKRLMNRKEGRLDDNEEVIDKRIESFYKETFPLVNEFEKQGNLIRINAERNVSEIFMELKRKLQEKGLV